MSGFDSDRGAEGQSSLPPPPPAYGSVNPPPGPSGSSGALDKLFSASAGLHRRQGSWNRWVRAVWWVLLLPVAAFCWAATLQPGWQRKAGLTLAALLALVGLVASLSSDEQADTGPARTVETIEDAVEPAETTSTTEPEAVSTTQAATTTTSAEPVVTTTLADAAEPSVAVEDLITAVEAGGDGSSPAAVSLLTQLEALIGEPDPDRSRYDRDAFFERADLDGDCINSRHETLQEEASEYTMSANGCSVAAGVWYDPFTDRTFTDPADLQVDHVVALGDAWASGAWAWSDARRKAFSNDLANLNAIYGPENQSKSDKGPARYSPSNQAQTCAYLVQYGSVKVAWGLTVSQADYDAISDGLSGCDDIAPAPVPVEATPTTAPAVTTAPTTTAAPTTTTIAPTTTTTADCHPAYSPCLPNLAGDAINCGDLSSSQKPVTVINPGVDPYRLDRNDDGTGCEGG